MHSFSAPRTDFHGYFSVKGSNPYRTVIPPFSSRYGGYTSTHRTFGLQISSLENSVLQTFHNRPVLSKNNHLLEKIVKV